LANTRSPQSWSGTATKPSCNWSNITEFNWYGCQVFVGTETADQLARTESEHPFIGPEPACVISIGVAKKAVRHWMSRYHKKMGIRNWTQTGKGTYIRVLCQKNEGSVEIKQRSIKRGGKTIYRTLSPKRAPCETGIDRWSHLRKVLRRRWISHTYSMRLWGHSLCQISSHGSVLYGTKWLLWRPHKQSPTFHSKCRINKELIKRGSTIDRWMSLCKGRIITATPHSFIHSFSGSLCSNLTFCINCYNFKKSRRAQSVQQQVKDWTTEVRFTAGTRVFL
jgi:hypothetical protein